MRYQKTRRYSNSSGYSRTGQVWSFREDELLRKDYLQGKSIVQMANELNREPIAIVHRLIMFGFIGYADSSNVPLNHNTPWSYGELEQLRQEYAQNQDIDNLAKKHQRQKNAILHKIVKMNLFDITDRHILEKFSDKTTSENATVAQLISGESLENIGKNTRGEKNMPPTKTTIETKIVNKKSTIITKLTGQDDAIYQKNRHQAQLETIWEEITGTVNFLNAKNNELTEIYANVPAIKKNIEAHQKERASLYENLNNVLTKENKHEWDMWKTTQTGRKVKSITVKQKFKDSDVDEMRYDSMMEFFDKYPEYSSKSSFKKILDKIEQKESEIRMENEKYTHLIAEYTALLGTFGINIQKADDKISAYKKLKNEAEDKIRNLPYNKSFLNKFRSEQAKTEANIDVLHHRLDEFETTLNIIKSQHAQYKKKMFVDMDY
jgi:hypothetical protein